MKSFETKSATNSEINDLMIDKKKTLFSVHFSQNDLIFKKIDYI